MVKVLFTAIKEQKDQGNQLIKQRKAEQTCTKVPFCSALPFLSADSISRPASILIEKSVLILNFILEQMQGLSLLVSYRSGRCSRRNTSQR